MEEELSSEISQQEGQETQPEGAEKPKRGRPPIVRPATPTVVSKPAENKVVRILEKNPLGMTLPEMAGGPRQIKRMKTLRPILAEAIKLGLIMPVSQRAGHTVYKLVRNMGPR